MEASSFFYVLGIALVVLAVVVSAIGLRNQRFPATRGALAGGLVLFIVLVGATTTFAVINARHEQEQRDEENAAAGAATEEETAAKEQKGESGPANVPATGGQPAAGGGSTVKLSADPGGDLAFDTDSLEAKAGEVTIDFDNPASIEHDVVIEEGNKEIAKSDLVSDGQTSVSADLKPGKYTFFCDVPGHQEAGMEGTLTVD
jgi:plastocyanin